MRLLLDTQVFLWLIVGDLRLPSPWHALITDKNVEVALSVASVWEATIKYHIGKLSFPGPPEIILPAERSRHQIASLGITEATVAELAKLPHLHRDPFDRILVAQAIQDQRTLLRVDKTLQQYPVACLP